MSESLAQGGIFSASAATGAVAPGFYRHYKGGLYQVLFSAKHTETQEWFVVYKSFKGRQKWTRPAQMFFETVCINGDWYPRFIFISNLRNLKRSSPEQLELFAA